MLRRRRAGKLIFFLVLISAPIILADYFSPHQHLPWRALNPDAPIGLATGTQITALALGPSHSCFSALAKAQWLSFTPATPKDGPGPCGWKRAALVTKTGNTSFAPAEVTGQCALALGLYIYARETSKLAEEILGAPLQQIHHFGTYSCRRQAGNSSNAWSEHAFANAVDIAAFELTDGRTISVKKDWADAKTPEEKAKRKFLRKSRNIACRLFRVVLSPDYNAAHHDHFHFDQGPSHSCR